MKLIDVHSHILPDIYLAAVKAAGVSRLAGLPIPDWNIEAHLKMMDDNGIQASILSLSSPGLEVVEQDIAPNLARAINIQFSEIIQNNPSRFGAFALLPLPNIEASLQEIAYALDALKLDGVGVLTNYEDKYLGDPQFVRIFDELNRRGAVLFVHPTRPVNGQRFRHGHPPPMLEYPFEMALVLLNLLDTELFERCTSIRFIFCHGGTAVPLLLPHFSSVFPAKKKTDRLSHLMNSMRVEREVGSIFLDLTAATHSAALAAIKETHPTSKLLLGLDYPFGSTVCHEVSENLNRFAGFSEQEKSLILSENAQGLLPRLTHFSATEYESSGTDFILSEDQSTQRAER